MYERSVDGVSVDDLSVDYLSADDLPVDDLSDLSDVRSNHVQTEITLIKLAAPTRINYYS